MKHGANVIKLWEKRLTNVRYANDNVHVAKQLYELSNMLTLLNEELREVGLVMRLEKTTILTSCSRVPYHMVDMDDMMISILSIGGCHKYLGFLFAFKSNNYRVGIEIVNKINAG